VPERHDATVVQSEGAAWSARAAQRSCRRRPEWPLPEPVARRGRTAGVLALRPQPDRFTGYTKGLGISNGPDLPFGAYLVTAKDVLSATSNNSGDTAFASCQLSSSTDPKIADNADWISPLAHVSHSDGYQADGTISFELPLSGGDAAGNVWLSCRDLSSPGVTIKAYYTRVGAIRTTSNH
jgi:hypothetical protein